MTNRRKRFRNPELAAAKAILLAASAGALLWFLFWELIITGRL